MFQGALAPYYYGMVITQDVTGIDCTTISAVVFHVEKPDGTQTTWTATLSGATTTQVTAKYTFNASVSEISSGGKYRIYGLCTIPGGSVRTDVDEVVFEFEYQKDGTTGA